MLVMTSKRRFDISVVSILKLRHALLEINAFFQVVKDHWRKKGFTK